MDCQAISRALQEMERDTSRTLRNDELKHVAACRACRAAVGRSDPSALFALLRFEKKEDPFWTGFETRVLARIREEESLRSGFLSRLLRPRFALLASGAAAIALIAVLAKTAGPAGPGSRVVDADGPDAAISGSDWVSRPLEADAAPPPPVETVASPTAHVISVKIESEQEKPGKGPAAESDVVLIVDGEIDI